MRAGVRSALLAVALLIAGCKTVPPPAPILGPGADAPWEVQSAALQKLDSYGVNGRVAVAAKGEGFTAALRYRQKQNGADLALDGPMGIGGMRIQVAENGVTMTDSKGRVLDGDAARSALEERLGFALPLAQLRWWLLGIPEPKSGETAQVPGMQPEALVNFEQDGWTVQINSRAPALGFSLPQRLTIERDGARMKLVAESWQP